MMPYSIEEKHIRNAYDNMRKRCYDTNQKMYYRYGGRGIGVDAAWLSSYHLFRDWAIANGYREGLTLDRINNDMGYSPENCRFVSRYVQARNRNTTIIIFEGGERMCLKDWAQKHSINYHTAWLRYHNGWSIERIKEKYGNGK